MEYIICKYLHLSNKLPSWFVMVSFTMKKCFRLISSVCLFLLLFLLPAFDTSKKILLKWMSKNVLPMLLPGVLWFQVLRLSFNPFLVYFCVWFKKVVQFYSFASNRPVFPTSCVEESFSSVQFSSVAQSCLTFCDPMNRSMPGLPVHHQLQEFTQTHVHRVSDAIITF